MDWLKIWETSAEFIDTESFSADIQWSALNAKCYMLDTRDKGLIFKPDLSGGIVCFTNADFSGGWRDGDHDLSESVLSCTGFVIIYSGCQIT